MRLLLLIMFLLAFDSSCVHAQIFGQRDFGRPLDRQSRRAPSVADSNSDAGQVTGAERFIRGNRDRASFVGADQSETQSFVGSQQGSVEGEIVSSTAGIEPPLDRSAEINQAIKMPTPKKMHLPKIFMSAQFIAETNRIVASRSTGQLQRSVNLASQLPIEVSVVERTATLRGVVTSAKEKRLAETLALFEPGISNVRNQLQIQSSPRIPVVQPVPRMGPSLIQPLGN